MAEIPLPSKDSTTPFRQFYPSWATGTNDTDWTAAEYADLGTDWPIVLCHYQQTGATATERSATIQAIKDAAAAVGHDVVVGVYVNGSFVGKSSAPDTAAYPTTAFARSTSNTHKYLIDSGDTFLMNPFSYDWNHTNRTSGAGRSVPDEAHFRRQGNSVTPSFDGWVLDNLGLSVVGASYNGQAKGDSVPTYGNAGADTSTWSSATKESPPDRILGGTYASGTSAAKWTEGTRLVASNVLSKRGRSGDTRYAHYVNGGTNGDNYFDASSPTSVLKRFCDLLMFEGWGRSASAAVTAFRTEAEWTRDLNAVLDLQRAGRGALLYTKVWDGSHTHDSRSAVSAVNASTDTVTTTAAHNLVAGDRVVFSGSGSITNVTKGLAYYVRTSGLTSTAFTLSTTGASGAIVDIGALSGTMNVANLYDPGDDDGDDASIVKCDRYLTASYLLVTNGKSYFHFRHDESGGTQRYRQHRWTSHIQDLGYYLETCTASISGAGANGVGTAYASNGLKQTDGTYRRLFSNGVVYVNATGSNIAVTAPYTAAETLTDVDGTVFAGNASITINANSGRILVTNQDAVTPPPVVDYTGFQAYQTGSSTTTLNTNYPAMKLISLFMSWNDIERTNNVFTWPANLDTSITDAHNDNYKITIRISCGMDSPISDRLDETALGWMASFVPYIRTLKNEQNPASQYDIPIIIPVPWDSTHLFYYQRFMAAVGARLAGACPVDSSHSRSEHVYFVPCAMPTENGTEMSIGYGQTATTWLRSGAAAATLASSWTAGSPANGGTFTLAGDVSTIPQPAAGQYVLLRIGGALGDNANSAPYAAGTELVLLSAFNRSTKVGTVATNGRGFSGTTATSHASGSSIYYADTTTTSGSLTVPITFDGKTGIFDHQMANRGQWAVLGTESARRILMGDAWISAINTQMDAMPGVKVGLAGSSVFRDNLAQATRVLDTLKTTKDYGKRLVCMTTRLFVSGVNRTYATASPVESAWMTKAAGYGHFIGFQTGGLSELAQGQDFVDACEDAIVSYPTRFIETNVNSRFTATTYVTTASGGWPGGTVTMAQYCLTNASNLQGRIPSS